MTRINLGVYPQELPDKLLLAEHREITRIPNAIKSKKAKIVDIPAHFTLGTGHVKYFYNKINTLYSRYTNIYDECVRRGFKITNKRSSFTEIPGVLWNHVPYEEIAPARQIVIKRIKSKGFELKPVPGNFFSRVGNEIYEKRIHEIPELDRVEVFKQLWIINLRNPNVFDGRHLGKPS